MAPWSVLRSVCSLGGCGLNFNLFAFGKKVFWSLPTPKTLSKTFQNLPKTFKNLSKTSPRPLRTPKTLSGLGCGAFPAFSGPRLLRVLSRLRGLIWVSSGPSGPLPSLFWVLGPLWGFCRPFLGLGASSGPFLALLSLL